MGTNSTDNKMMDRMNASTGKIGALLAAILISLMCVAELTSGQTPTRIYERDNPPNEADVQPLAKRPVVSHQDNLYLQSTHASNNTLAFGISPGSETANTLLWRYVRGGLYSNIQGRYIVTPIVIANYDPLNSNGVMYLYEDIDGSGTITTGDRLIKTYDVQGITNTGYSYAVFSLDAIISFGGAWESYYYASNFLNFFMGNSNGQREWRDSNFKTLEGVTQSNTQIAAHDTRLTHNNSVPFYPFSPTSSSMAAIHLVVFPNNSPLTHTIIESNEMKGVFKSWITTNQIQAFVESEFPPTDPDGSRSISVPSNRQHVANSVQFNSSNDADLYFAFGKAAFDPSLKITSLNVIKNSGTYTIMSAYTTGALRDLYDFDYNGGTPAWWAASAQIAKNSYLGRPRGMIYEIQVNFGRAYPSFTFVEGAVWTY